MADANSLLFGKDSKKNFWSQPAARQSELVRGLLGPDEQKDYSESAIAEYIAGERQQAEKMFGSISASVATEVPPATRQQSEPVPQVKAGHAGGRGGSATTKASPAVPTAEAPPATRSWMDTVGDLAKGHLAIDKAFYTGAVNAAADLPGTISAGLGKIGTAYADASKSFGKQVKHGVTKVAGDIIPRTMDSLQTPEGQKKVVDIGRGAVREFGEMGHEMAQPAAVGAMVALTVLPEFGAIGIGAAELAGYGMSAAQLNTSVRSIVKAIDSGKGEDIGAAITEFAAVYPVLKSIHELKKAPGKAKGLVDLLREKIKGSKNPEAKKLEIALERQVASGSTETPPAARPGSKPDAAPKPAEGPGKRFGTPATEPPPVTRVEGTPKIFPPKGEVKTDAAPPAPTPPAVEAPPPTRGEPTAEPGPTPAPTPHDPEKGVPGTGQTQFDEFTGAEIRHPLDETVSADFVRGPTGHYAVIHGENAHVGDDRWTEHGPFKTEAEAREFVNKKFGIKSGAETPPAAEPGPSEPGGEPHAETHHTLGEMVKDLGKQAGVGEVTFTGDNGKTVTFDVRTATPEQIREHAVKLGELKNITAVPSKGDGRASGIGKTFKTVEGPKTPPPIPEGAPPAEGVPEVGETFKSPKALKGRRAGEVWTYAGIGEGGMHVIEDQFGRPFLISAEDLKGVYKPETPSTGGQPPPAGEKPPADDPPPNDRKPRAGATRIAGSPAVGEGAGTKPGAPAKPPARKGPSSLGKQGGGSAVNGSAPQPSRVGPPDESRSTGGDGSGIEMARTSTGKAKIGANVAALAETLGSSLYSGNPHQVITKELIQNSMDAVRGVKDGAVTVDIDTDGNSWDPDSIHKITVNDNGVGMTKNDLETVFLDLGDSGKRENAEASGGFGLAKAAPLMMSDQIHVTTTADSGGKRYTSTMFTNKGELLGSGATITTKEVGKTVPTGTKIVSYLKGRPSGVDAVTGFGKNALRSVNPPGTLTIRHNGVNAGVDEWSSKHLNADERKSRKIAGTLTTSGAKVDVHVTHGKKDLTHDAGTVAVEINNNGIYQFTHNMYLGEKATLKGVPSVIAADVKATVKEGHTDYPFTANREEIRPDLKKAIDKWVQDNVIAPTMKEASDFINKKYINLPNIGSQFEVAFYDTGARLEPHEVEALKNNKDFTELSEDLAQVMDDVLGILGESPKLKGTSLQGLGSKIERAGVVFSDAVHGVHITNKATGKATAFINPFTFHESSSPIEAATLNFHTIKHEILHDIVTGHVESFTSGLVRIDEAVGQYFKEGVDRLHYAYADPDNPGEFRKGIREALRIYKESRRRPERERDPFRGQESSNGDHQPGREPGGTGVLPKN